MVHMMQGPMLARIVTKVGAIDFIETMMSVAQHEVIGLRLVYCKELEYDTVDCSK